MADLSDAELGFLTDESGHCPDCGLPVAGVRCGSARVDPMSCGARFSAYYELQCKRLAMARLRAQLSDWRLIKDEPVVLGRLAVIKAARPEVKRG